MKIRPIFCFCALFCGVTFTALGAFQVQDLACEYDTQPLGLDVLTPQFSWEIQSDERNMRQSAYQVMVLKRGADAPVWDSGRVNSSVSAGIRYAGAPLESRAEYLWKVRVWDSAENEGNWSEPGRFEMGLRDGDWFSHWMAFPAGNQGRVSYFAGGIYPAKPLAKARLYISGLGYYEARINGQKVGDRVLEPAQSNYSKHVYYSTYDITGMLHEGANPFVIIVAPGWYGGQKYRFQVELTYEDGTTAIMPTEHVRSVASGPILYSTVFDGEDYDARLENPVLSADNPSPGWEMNPTWSVTTYSEPPGGIMTSQKMEPIKVTGSLSPKLLSEPKPGIYVFDTLQNLAGWAKIKVKGKAGDKVTLKFAESLYNDKTDERFGQVNQENLRNARATDTYILKGSEDYEVWEPHFTYHGFRYIQVEGLAYKPEADTITVQIVRNAVEPLGTFECSNELLNRIHKMIVATEASNLHAVPTDCPQRDERMGWLNDLTVRIEQAMFNFDMSRFYPKFLQDVTDTQDEHGTITCTAPFRFGNRPADPVCTSYLLLAYEAYRYYGNTTLIEQHYPNMKAWVDYLRSRTGAGQKASEGIVDYSYYGDWCPPIAHSVNGDSPLSAETPGNLMSTGYLYYCANLLTKMASVLGLTDDAQKYHDVALKTAEAFNQEWWNEEQGGYGANNQSANAFALYLGLVKKENIARVAENLARDVEKNDFHLTTGNLCTKYLLEMLTEHGYPEAAYKVAAQTTYPSWGFMLANGATTLWERWELATGKGMNSHNHPMMGSADSWFYKYLLGIIPDVEHPAFAQFRLRPYIMDELTHVRGTYKTIKGTISTAWEKKDGKLNWEVTIPANTVATTYVPVQNANDVLESGRPLEDTPEVKKLGEQPGWIILELGGGTYRFETPWADTKTNR